MHVSAAAVKSLEFDSELFVRIPTRHMEQADAGALSTTELEHGQMACLPAVVAVAANGNVAVAARPCWYWLLQMSV